MNESDMPEVVAPYRKPIEPEMTTYECADGESIDDECQWWNTSDAFDANDEPVDVIEKRWLLVEYRILCLGGIIPCSVCDGEDVEPPCAHCGDTGEEPRIEPPFTQVTPST